MALSGSIKRYFCNNTCIMFFDWSATPDVLTGTHTVTFKIYLDTSSTERISTVSAYSNKSYVTFNNETKYYSTPKVSSKGKTLMGTVSFASVKIGESSKTFSLKAAVYLNGMRAYTSLTSYITSAEYVNCVDAITLDGISRISKIENVGTASERVLGNNHYYTINKAHDNFTTTIRYTCGNKSGYICQKTSDTRVLVNLPIELAECNTEGAELTVSLYVYTYYGNDEIANNEDSAGYAIYTIPKTLRPSCTISLSDAEKLKDTYGAYVQQQSRFKIEVSPVLAYNSPIKKYVISANGKTYQTGDTDFDPSNILTGLLIDSGESTITATVTDGRGRSYTTSVTVEVIPWLKPVVKKITVHRTDAEGVEKSGGEYITVNFDAEVSPLNNLNSASYMLRYQKSSGLDQNDISLTDYKNMLTVTDGEYRFPADIYATYQITIFATDNFDTGSRKTSASSAVTLINFGADGESIAFGVLATIAKTLEVAFKQYPSGGFMFPTIEPGSSLYGIRTPNVYTCENGQDVGQSPTNDPYTLIVLPGGGEGDLIQIAITAVPEIYIKRLTDASWSGWYRFALTAV